MQRWDGPIVPILQPFEGQVNDLPLCISAFRSVVCLFRGKQVFALVPSKLSLLDEEGDDGVLVMGIDPGIAITGYSFVRKGGQGSGQAEAYGCIRTPAHTELSSRLLLLYRDLNVLLEEHHPDVVAVEELFFNRNTTTAFPVAQARGVVLLAAAQHGLTVAEYTPLQVKQAVVGYGRAEKQQVQQMVKVLLNLPSLPKPDDVADAMAIAICHLHSNNYLNLAAKRRE